VSGYELRLLELARLRPTEEVDAAHVRLIAAEMRRDGVQRQPVLIERQSFAILDGHHRFHAARLLELSAIAAVVIDYEDPRLTLLSWTDRRFTRHDVLAAARSGQLLPRKSTRHVLDPPTPCAPVALRDLARLPGGVT
jgi:ParB-like chromosome segregation protein Spo0J